MWGLFLFPLLAILFVGGAVVALAWFFGRPRDRRPSGALLIGIPFGCLALPFIGFILIGIVGSLLQSSDTELFEEIFGYRPTITEDRMLFDDFGSGRNREIYMRAEPNEAERRRLFSIPGAVESDFDLVDFESRGITQGFMWWISASDTTGDYCKSARILDAHGYRGWTEFRIAECLDAGAEFPASATKGKVYVIATGRDE